MVISLGFLSAADLELKKPVTQKRQWVQTKTPQRNPFLWPEDQDLGRRGRGLQTFPFPSYLLCLDTVN